MWSNDDIALPHIACFQAVAPSAMELRDKAYHTPLRVAKAANKHKVAEMLLAAGAFDYVE